MVNDITVQRSRQAAIDRATAKAIEQATAGNRPTRLRQFTDDPTQTVEVWSVGSRTTGGTIYLIDLIADASGIETHCQCEAQHAGRVCWHRAAVRMAALDTLPQPAPRPAVTAAELSGHRPDPSDPRDWTLYAAD